MSPALLAEVVLRFVALVGVGVLLRLTGLLKTEDTRPINTLIIWVGLPALIFQAVHPAPLDPGVALLAVVAWAAILAGAGAAWLAGRALKLPPATLGALVLVSALGNTGFIGYPLAEGLLGEKGLVSAVFYDMFGTVAAILTLGVLVANKYGAEETKAGPLRALALFPGAGALVLALLLRPLAVPDPVSLGLDTLAKLVVPLIMISVGLSVRRADLWANRGSVGVAAAIKLVALPALALLVGPALLREPEAVRLAVLQAGTPTMMLTLVWAQRFGLDTSLVAATILVTTVASALTVPVFQLLA